MTSGRHTLLGPLISVYLDGWQGWWEWRGEVNLQQVQPLLVSLASSPWSACSLLLEEDFVFRSQVSICFRLCAKNVSCQWLYPKPGIMVDLLFRLYKTCIINFNVIYMLKKIMCSYLEALEKTFPWSFLVNQTTEFRYIYIYISFDSCESQRIHWIQKVCFAYCSLSQIVWPSLHMHSDVRAEFDARRLFSHSSAEEGKVFPLRSPSIWVLSMQVRFCDAGLEASRGPVCNFKNVETWSLQCTNCAHREWIEITRISRILCLKRLFSEWY